jgi:dihydrolipoamide dehydrogenase
MAETFDLVVVGGGPGGYVAAMRAAQLGLSVALVEKEQLGGVCLNWGCIPTKALLASAGLMASVSAAGEMGVLVDHAEADPGEVFGRKDRVVEKLRSGVATLLRKRSVAVFKGTGEIQGGSVVVESSEDTKELACDKVILATGSSPVIPAAFPYDGRVVVSTRDALSRSDIPDSVLIVGGGAVGCEFAGFYAALSRSVTLVEMLPDILPGEDASAVRFLRAAMKKRGIDVRIGTRVASIDVSDDRARTTLSDDSVVESGLVLLAMGRRPNVDGAGIPATEIATERGAVVVNERMETSVPGVYAIGDLIGGWLLAHVASREGIVAASNIAGRDTVMSYAAVPRCTFTVPEIASVGVTEADAKKQGMEVTTGRFPYGASGKAVAEGKSEGFVKIVCEPGGGKVMGGVIVGARASDLVHEITLAVHAGLTAETMMSMIHAHPTFSESVMEAAEAVEGLSIHSL